MSELLRGKVVVVTGAASGIGRAIAIAAAQHGAKVVIVSDITETPREGGRPTTGAIETLGVVSRFFRADVAQRSEVDALIDSAATFGGVDLMVCNAGIALRSDDADVAEEDYRRQPLSVASI
jgi:NAD(P)-dependent dehydrogenase (short-subunit alcohol dehydrogenase family)